MRVLFAASSAIAVPSLEAVFNEKKITLAGILTNPDSPKGRHGTPCPTEIGAAAETLRGTGVNIPILKPAKLDSETRMQVAALKPDILLSFAYGKIFKPEFLNIFPMGGINVHPSLLPKYRGPTPIQAAILNRDTQTGISIQKLAKEVDSGDVFVQEPLQLTGTETSASLGEIIAQKAAELLPPLLWEIAQGKARAVPQNHGEASYCSLITSEDGRIDWSKSALEIDARIRAFDPWPLCWTLHNGLKLFILKAAVYCQNSVDFDNNPENSGLVLGIEKKLGILIQTGDGLLAVKELQYQAKKALEWRAFINGARNFSGSRLK